MIEIKQQSSFDSRPRTRASLSLIVRRMSAATHRAVELLVGFALLGYGAYALYAGHVKGKFRSYSRNENPLPFWTTVLITLGVAAMFFFGAVSWRN